MKLLTYLFYHSSFNRPHPHEDRSLDKAQAQDQGAGKGVVRAIPVGFDSLFVQFFITHSITSFPNYEPNESGIY